MEASKLVQRACAFMSFIIDVFCDKHTQPCPVFYKLNAFHFFTVKSLWIYSSIERFVFG